jgi:hypothetical protein
MNRLGQEREAVFPPCVIDPVGCASYQRLTRLEFSA